MNFVRKQYPQARFTRLYDANEHGWKALDFHSRCNQKGSTLSIVQTEAGLTFGGFTTASWESPPNTATNHESPTSFLFSVDQGIVYPISNARALSTACWSEWGPVFGEYGQALAIAGESNNNNKSYCKAKDPSFKLPEANQGEMGSSSFNGGKVNFTNREFEVYQEYCKSYLFILLFFEGVKQL